MINLSAVTTRSARYAIHCGDANGDPVCDAKVTRSGRITSRQLRAYGID